MMKHVIRRRLVVAAIGGLLLSMAAPASAAAAGRPTDCSWQLTRLSTGPLPAAQVIVNGTDSAGSYSGFFLGFTQPSEVLLWNRGSSEPVIVSPPPGYLWPHATGENRSGAIAMSAERSDGSHRAFVYTGGHTGAGVYRQLPLPAGYTSATPEGGINDRGDVAGVVSRSGQPAEPIRWPGDGGPSEVLVGFEPMLFSVRDIDVDGTVLLETADGPYLWRPDGQVVQLAQPAGHQRVTPVGISRGTVVGYAFTDDYSTQQGFLWRTPSRPVAIPGSYQVAGINAYGLIAGDSKVTAGPGVWFATHFIGELPVDNSDGASIRLVGDDNSIGGISNGPVIWRFRCS